MKSEKKLISYLIIIISFVILFTFASTHLRNIFENQGEIRSKKAKLEQLERDHKKISNIETEVNSPNYKNINELKKYKKDIIENELIDYFYGYVKDNYGKCSINSLSLNKGSKNEYGFNEGSINLSMNFSSEDEMMKMLDFITGDSSEYKFFINNFSYGYGDDELRQLQINFPIKVFYK